MEQPRNPLAFSDCVVTRRTIHTGARLTASRQAGHDLLMYFTEANLMMRVEHRLYSLVDGSVVLLPRGAPYSFAHGAGCSYYCLAFTPAGPDSRALAARMLTRYSTHLHLEDPDTRAHIALQMRYLNEHLQRRTQLPEALHGAYEQSCVTKLLMDVHALQVREDQLPPLNPRQQLAEQVASFIDDNLLEPLSLSLLESTFFLSRFHLCRLFKAARQMTIFEYIRNKRAQAAADLLLRSDLPVTQIALECGFGNQQSFYNAFAAVYGQTPLRYRRTGRHARM